MFKNGLALGHMIECFDHTLYGFFAVYLSTIFFPNESHFMQIVGTFGAFAAGYLSKPFGAVVFGIIGDKIGPTIPLTYSIGLAGLPAIIIGLLPTPESIGIAAPVILILCRVMQGFLVGGEFSGANIYLFETTDPKQLGKTTGLFIASGVAGALLATISGFIVFSGVFGDAGWRLPFIIGGVLAFLCFALRRTLVPLARNNQSYMDSLRVLYKDYKPEFIYSFFLSGLTTIPLVLTTVFSNKIYQDLGFSMQTSMVLNAFTMIINSFLLIGAGKIADKIGFTQTIKLGCTITMLVSVPAFWLVSEGGTIVNALSFIILMMTSGTIINGCTFPLVISLFPKDTRYTALAVSYTLGIAILSGLSPLIATYLESWFDSKVAIALYPILICLITLYLHSRLFAERDNQLIVNEA